MTQRKHYNPYSKYGQRKMRDDANYKYKNGTKEYRDEIDNIGFQVWAVILFICFVIFVIIWLVSGPDAAFGWLE